MKNKIKKLLDDIFNRKKDVNDLSLDDLLRPAIEWFIEYQGEENPSTMLILYRELTKEELEEARKASREGNFIEYLDGVIDYAWVNIGYIYFTYKFLDHLAENQWPKKEYMENLYAFFIGIINNSLIDPTLFKIAWLEVAYSNWTKSKQLNEEGNKKGKVIKGPDFVKPNLEKVLKFAQAHYTKLDNISLGNTKSIKHKNKKQKIKKETKKEIKIKNKKK